MVWLGSFLFRHDICFLSISRFCGSASQSFDCHSLREGGRPQAMAFIYRDRLIWVCRFRQRRLNCTQGNSSCKTSYEYETLAEFYNVIVYLLSTLSFAQIFCVPCFLEPLKSQGFRPFGTQRRTWHNFLPVQGSVCFCAKFYVNLFSHSGIQIAPECSAAKEQVLSSA